MSTGAPPLTHGTDIAGRAICVAEFLFQGEHHLAVGRANGIYVRNRDRMSDSPFRSVLKVNKPTSIAAFPESNEFLVHCESALYSYPLDLIVHVSRTGSTHESLDESKEKLAEGHGDILFFKAGSVSDRTSIVYAVKNSKQVTLHVLELTHHEKNGNRQTPADRASHRPLGSPVPILEDPHDATFSLNKVAICTSKAIHVMELTNTHPSVKVVPEFPNFKKPFLGSLNGTLSKANTLLSLGKSDSDTPSILKLVEKAKVLGLVIHGSKTLIVYDELGCFIDEDGKPAGSRYYTPWECTAGACAHRGPHLLLFSSEIIEVRSVDTGKFIQIIEISHLRPLRCGSSEQGMLVAAMSNGAEGDDDYTEKLVEVAYNSK
ncbi:citron-like protein [Russula dissimulans]|nr:citron-like protein [Russula dissimulans]